MRRQTSIFLNKSKQKELQLKHPWMLHIVTICFHLLLSGEPMFVACSVELQNYQKA